MFKFDRSVLFECWFECNIWKWICELFIGIIAFEQCFYAEFESNCFEKYFLDYNIINILGLNILVYILVYSKYLINLTYSLHIGIILLILQNVWTSMNIILCFDL